MIRPKHLLVPAVLVGLGACSALRSPAPMERDATYRLDRGLSALDAGRYREAFDDLAWVETHCAGHARGAEALVALAALELDPRNAGSRPGLGMDLLAQVLRQPAPPAWVRPLAATSYLMGLSLGAPAAPDLLHRPTPDTAAVTPDTAAVRPDAAAVRPDTAPVRPDTAPVRPDTAPVRVDTRPVEGFWRGPERARAPALPSAAPPTAPPGGQPARGCGARVDPETWAAPRLPDLPGPPLVALLSAAETSRNAATARADSVDRELQRVTQRLAETEAELERIRKTLQP